MSFRTPELYTHQTPKESRIDYERRAYLSIHRSSKEALAVALKDAKWATALVNWGFWQMHLSEYSERHLEAADTGRVLADTFVSFATGALPVEIQASGVVHMTPTQDHRLSLLHLYNRVFRGTRLQSLGVQLQLVVRDTVMLLAPTELALGVEAELQDYARFTIAGAGYRYSVANTETVPRGK